MFANALFYLSLPFLILATPAFAYNGEAVDFELKTFQGSSYKLSDQRGKWIIINFWASWCLPCVEEIPEFNRYQKDHPEDIVIGIDFEQIDHKTLRVFLNKHPMHYQLLTLVDDKPLLPFEPLQGLPTTVIVSPAGQMMVKHTGIINYQAIEEFINQQKAAKKVAVQ